MSVVDPFELFGLCDPYVDEGFTEADAARVREITAMPYDEVGERRRKRRRPWIIGGAVIVIAGATAAFAVIRSDHAANPTTIACYDEPSGGTPHSQTMVAASEDPIAACSELWTNGDFGTGEPPPLVACVNQYEVAVVMPGEAGTCADYDLAELEIEWTDEQRAVVELQSWSVDEVNVECIDEPTIRAAVDDKLDALDLDDWSVVDGNPFSAEHPCAVLQLWPVEQEVMIHGSPLRD